MKVRIRYSSWFVRKGYSAWVLFPFIFFRDKKDDVSDKLFRHEMEHVYQILRIGWFKFYFRYLYANIRFGYSHNPFEIAAHNVQNRSLTETERNIKEKT